MPKTEDIVVDGRVLEVIAQSLRGPLNEAAAKYGFDETLACLMAVILTETNREYAQMLLDTIDTSRLEKVAKA